MDNHLQKNETKTAPDYADLTALIINCTLKKSPALSHTHGLISVAKAIMEKNGVAVEELRAVDADIAPGVWPDMTKQGLGKDDWPQMAKKVLAADILILGTPIWLGEKSSVCQRVIERLYSHSGELNDRGQYVFYGKVGGVHHYGQRGRYQALWYEYLIRSTTSRLYDPSPGRLWLGWRSRAWTVLSR